jgi:hypothetical protein
MMCEQDILLFAYLHVVVVKAEEALLARQFLQAYGSYCAQVPGGSSSETLTPKPETPSSSPHRYDGHRCKACIRFVHFLHARLPYVG